MAASDREVFDATRLSRLLNPRSIAIVGMRSSVVNDANARIALDHGITVYFVHPTAKGFLGLPAFRSLRDLPEPPDAVMLLTGADTTPALVMEAGEVGAGGVVVIAGGFAEQGEEGRRLQETLEETAVRAGIPILGPNSAGLVNVTQGASLTILAPFARERGGVSVVTQSGAVLEGLAAAAHRPGGVGFRHMISTGNEAVTDLADYVGYLAGDADTRVILLIVEAIRRPAEFFASVDRALGNDKPVIAVKLGRRERSRALAASHTSALAGDAWAYDVAFRHAGILIAEDLDDLIARAHLFEKLPPARWSPMEGLGVLTISGGMAQLIVDRLGDGPVQLPELDGLHEFVAANVPGATVANPLDVTGFVGHVADRWKRIVELYAEHGQTDALLYVGQHAEWDDVFGGMAREFADQAEGSVKPFILAPLAGIAGAWTAAMESSGVVIGADLRGTLAGVESMASYVRQRRRGRRPLAPVLPRERPVDAPIEGSIGSALPFTAAMRMLQSAGIPVAPFYTVDDEGPLNPPFSAPYVVKLAEVPHRTIVGAVRVGVTDRELHAVVMEMRSLARRIGSMGRVVIQPELRSHGEVFIGLRSSEIGPLVAFGVGGADVELQTAIPGRMAPFTEEDARELVEDLAILEAGGLDRPAGSRKKETLVRVLLAAGDIVAGSMEWLESMDINPLLLTEDGPVAVDALCILRGTVDSGPA